MTWKPWPYGRGTVAPIPPHEAPNHHPSPTSHTGPGLCTALLDREDEVTDAYETLMSEAWANDQLADRLDDMVRETHAGGWSTQHVKQLTDAANELRRRASSARRIAQLVGT